MHVCSFPFSQLDTEFVYTGELKKLLEPLTGLPVHDQILAYEGEIMRGKALKLCGGRVA